MRCKTALNLLGPYLDRQLNSRSSAALKKHLAACPKCWHEFESFRSVKIKMGSLQVPPIPPFLADRIVACASDAPHRPQIGWILHAVCFQISKWMAPAALACGILMGVAMGISNPPRSYALPPAGQSVEMDAGLDYVYSLCCRSVLDRCSIEQVTLALMEN